MQQLLDQRLSVEIKEFCCQLWSLSEVSLSMPCSNPCSMMRNDIWLLKTRQYWVAEKTDGIRMFLILGVYDDLDGSEKKYSVFINRAFQLFLVDVQAPDECYAGSLFDGELVTTNTSDMTYTVFDTIAASGFNITHHPQSQRIQATQLAFAAIQFNDPIIRVVVKQWYPISNARLVYERALHCDGLIFVPEHGPLLNGTQNDTFKWKVAAKHTIDFLLNSNGVLYLMDRTAIVEASVVAPFDLADTDHARAFISTSPVIIECECVLNTVGGTPPIGGNGKKKWIATPIRVRTDKERANSVRVARATLQNIVENVLLSEIEACT